MTVNAQRMLELAEAIHKARWPEDRQMDITPFSDEDKNGRDYCFRIARAVAALSVPRPDGDAPDARQAAIEECARHVETTGLRNPDNIVRDIRALSGAQSREKEITRLATIAECAMVAESDRCASDCGDPGCVTAKGIAAAIRELAISRPEPQTASAPIPEYWIKCPSCGFVGRDILSVTRPDGESP